jgi:HlyD family secretion protein
MKWIKRTVSVTLVFALLALLGWSFMPRPVEVETAQVSKGRFVLTIDEDGHTQVRNRYVVSAPLVGRLQRITLQEGDAVQKDAVLAAISSSLRNPANPASMRVFGA